MLRLARLASILPALSLFAACAPVEHTFSSGGAGGMTTSSSSESSTSTSTSTGTGGGGPTPAWVSGTRLRARLQDGGGPGAQVFQGWQDKQLGEPCTFVTTQDGMIRCAPGLNSQVWYGDAACTQKVAVANSCGDPSLYAVDQGTYCGAKLPAYHVYKLGSAQGSGQFYQLIPGQGCQAAGQANVLYSVTEAQVDTFVSATIAKEPRGKQLEAEILQGDDGSRQISPVLYDTKAAAECSLYGIGNNQMYCLPGSNAYVEEGNFTKGPNCSGNVVVQFDADKCPPATVAVDYGMGGNGCTGPMISLVSVGAPVPVDQVQQFCQPVDPSISATAKFYDVAASVDFNTFASAALARDSKSQLAAQYWAVSTGEQIGLPQQFFDTQANQGCYPQLFSDMKTRCVPYNTASVAVGPGYSNTYEDAGCTKLLVPLYMDPNCPQPLPQHVLIQDPAAATMCNGYPTSEVHAIGIQYTGSAAWVGDPTNCQAIMLPPPTSGQLYFEVGGIESVDVFVTVNTIVE
jgi:hypothetical protein